MSQWVNEPMSKSGENAEGLNAEFLHFLVVVLPVEDVPLLGALEDGAPLALDFLAGGLIYLCLFLQQVFQDLAGLHADGVAIFEEIYILHVGERIGHGVGQLVHLVAREPHSTALYLRTSSFFTFLNISW